MNKKKIMTCILLTFASVFIFASGNQENNVESASKSKQYTENEITELWNSTAASFYDLARKQPGVLILSFELTNSKYQSLLEQFAEAGQEIVAGELTRTITPIETAEEAGPPEGPPEDGAGGRGSGGPGSGGPGQSSGGPRSENRNESEDSHVSFNYELAETVIGLWDQSFQILKMAGDNLIHGKSTGELEQIFNLSCMKFNFSNDEIDGSLWIDVENGIPVKTEIHNSTDGNLNIELFVLPGYDDDIRISKMFFSKILITEDEQDLLLKGTVEPDFTEVELDI